MKSRAAGLLIVAGALLANLAVCFALLTAGASGALALAVLPLAGIALVGLLTETGRAACLCAALGLALYLPFLTTIPFGGAALYFQDLIVLLALGAWIAAKLIGRGPTAPPPVPATPVVGVALLVFAMPIVAATLRGHYSYGASVVGQPLRLILYSAIVVTLAGFDAERLRRLLLSFFYLGTVVTMTWAAYYIATGTSQTDQAALSTGGERILGISTSIYLAGALFLALLHLPLAHTVKEQALHVAIGLLAAIGVGLGFGRAVYASVAVATLLVFVSSRQLRRVVVRFAPMAAPFLVAAAILVPLVAPDLIPSFVDRPPAAPVSDANVQWRVKANEAVVRQFREDPIFGVGFGRADVFWIETEDENGFPYEARQDIGQDPHNGYLFLLAGGGVLALGAFLLLLLVFAVDATRRFRSADAAGKLIVTWAGMMLFVSLVNAASGTTFSSPGDLLTIWALLVLPAVVPLPVTERMRGRRATSAVHPAQPAA